MLEFKPGETPDPQSGFFDMGMASVAVARFHRLLEKQLNVKMNDSALFEYPTVSKLSGYLLELMCFSEFESEDRSVGMQDERDETMSSEVIASNVSEFATNENISEAHNRDMEEIYYYDTEKGRLPRDKIKDGSEFKLRTILSGIGNIQPDSDLLTDLEHIPIEEETMLREKVENRLDEVLQQIGI